MPTIDVNGVAIAYRESGAGAPVVLLHSSASSGRQWESLAAVLASRHRVLAVDLHGYGESGGWHGERPFELADEAAIVAALAARLGGPLHLVGHSYGGAVALVAALRLAPQIASLTVIEPAAFHLLRGGEAGDLAAFHEIRGVAEALAAAANRGDERRAMAGFIDYWNGSGAWCALSGAAQSRLAPLARKIVLEFGALFAEPTRRAACRALGAPTLALRGTESPVPARRAAEIVAEFAPNARLEVVAGAGHMLPLTHAEQVNGAIAAHIAAASDPSSGLFLGRAA